MATTTEVRTLTLNQAINEAIRLEMRRDPNVIIIGEELALRESVAGDSAAEKVREPCR